jgi:hypothetical protein
MAFPAHVTAEQLLDAMEGVAYLTDLDGVILAVGHKGWADFAADNAVPWLKADAVIGTSLFAALSGDATLDAYRRLHAALISGRRAETVFEYRCDSPIAERHMRMSITAVAGEAGVAAVLYQSQMLAEVTRPALRLFSRDLRASRRQVSEPRRMVLLCSFCQRVAWPIGSNGKTRRWIDATEYYRLGGPSDVTVSDSVCRECAKQVVAPNV